MHLRQLTWYTDFYLPGLLWLFQRRCPSIEFTKLGISSDIPFFVIWSLLLMLEVWSLALLLSTVDYPSLHSSLDSSLMLLQLQRSVLALVFCPWSSPVAFLPIGWCIIIVQLIVSCCSTLCAWRFPGFGTSVYFQNMNSFLRILAVFALWIFSFIGFSNHLT